MQPNAYQTYLNQNGGAAQPQAPATHANPLLSLIPTATSVLGGIGGSLLGGPLGGIAGAGLGGGIGRGIENAVEGQNPLQGNDVTSALEGAGGQMVGGAMGSVLGKLGGMVANPLEKGAAQLVAGQANKGLIGPDLAQSLLQDHGITDLRQAGQLAKVVTGSADSDEGQALINKAVESGINKYGPDRVDVADYALNPVKPSQAGQASAIAAQNGNMVQDAISRNYLTPNQAKGVMTNVTSIQKALPQTITGATDSTSALNFQRQLANLAAEQRGVYIKSGYQDQSALNLSKAYGDLSDNLHDRIFAPGGQDVAVPQEEKDALSQMIQQHAAPINQKAADAISQEVQNANTYSDLRATQAKWVNVNQALQKTEDMANNNFGTSTRDMMRAGLPIMGAVAGGPKGAAMGLVGAAASSPAADRVGAAGLTKVADALKNMGEVRDAAMAGSYRPSSVLGGMGGAALGGVAGGTDQNGQSALSLTQGMPQGNNMNPMNPNMSAPTLSGNPMSSIGLSQQLDAMLAADPYLAASIIPSLAGTMPQAQALEAASPTMQSYLSTLGASGAGQGPMGGLLQTLGGALTGGAAAQVSPQQQALAHLLQQAGLPGMSVPGLMANGGGLQAGLAPTQNVLSTLGAY